MDPCIVHPYATGGEINTIGLYPHEGQPKEERYAEWVLLRRGEGPCTCSREGHVLIARTVLPNGVGIAASYVGPPQRERFTVQVVADGEHWNGHLEYAPSIGGQLQLGLNTCLAEYERLKAKWAPQSSEQVNTALHQGFNG